MYKYTNSNFRVNVCGIGRYCQVPSVLDCSTLRMSDDAYLVVRARLSLDARRRRLHDKTLGYRSLPPTDLGRVKEEMASPGGRPLLSVKRLFLQS
ncbi:hypothetical protein TNCV_1599301 [Trichonephila clavipes]|nr:hypothetical protein TNCV_1599301 [Trichonephila clavipes]